MLAKGLLQTTRAVDLRSLGTRGMRGCPSATEASVPTQRLPSRSEYALVDYSRARDAVREQSGLARPGSEHRESRTDESTQSTVGPAAAAEGNAQSNVLRAAHGAHATAQAADARKALGISQRSVPVGGREVVALDDSD